MHADQLIHILEPNIHAFTHYLAHPAVHIPILELLYDKGSVKPSQKRKAIERFESDQWLGGPIVEKIKDRLEALNVAEGFPWAKFDDLQQRYNSLVRTSGTV